MPRKPTSDSLPSVAADSTTTQLFDAFNASGDAAASSTMQAPASTAGAVATLSSRQSTLAKMRTEAKERLEALDELSRQIAREGRDPTLIELEAYHSAGLTDETSVRREIHRARAVNKLQAICGDGAYRARCKAELEDAYKALEERGGTLREQIAELTRELNSLESNARFCRDRQEKIELACSELALRLPRHIQDAYDNARRRAKAIDAAHRNALRVRVDELSRVVDRKESHDRVVVEHCKRLSLGHDCYAWHEVVGRDSRGVISRTRVAHVKQDAWDKLRAEYVAELERIKPELEALDAAVDERLQEAAKLATYYIPE